VNNLYFETYEEYLVRAKEDVLKLFTTEECRLIYDLLARGIVLSTHQLGDTGIVPKAKELMFRFGPSFQEMTPELEAKTIKNTIERIKQNPEWIKKTSEDFGIPIPEGWLN